LGAILVLVSGTQLLIQETRIPGGEALVILERGGDRLSGTYYPGSIDSGVVLAEGFGSDQTALKSLVEVFSLHGYHVLTFDFSGHGRSQGGLGFDNAETDRLALQIQDALGVFEEITRLDRNEILIVGHSLGSRAALQYASLEKDPVAGLILLGTQVNLVTNVQAEVFTGVVDANLNWIQDLGPNNPRSNILLISSDWDDILPPEAAGLLMEKLAGVQTLPGKGFGSVEENNYRRWIQLDGVLHNFQIYSQKALFEVLAGAESMLGRQGIQKLDPGTAQTRYLSWAGGVLGLFLLLIGLNGSLPGQILESETKTLILEHPRRYFVSKIMFWIPALIPGALLGGLIFLLPLGNPAYNLIYISFLGGYGILLLVLYHQGWMPGVRGKLKLYSIHLWNRSAFYVTGIFILITLVITFYARTGWFYTLAANHRLIWALVFSPITALGFWIGWQENLMLSAGSGKVSARLIANGLIGLLPFFLYAGFLASIGSLSGVVGAVQGLVILAFSIACGVLFQKIGRNFFLTAIFQSFLIYWLILAQGVLFQ
jgi:pimeloyl-ACP methyl ester carboxylesterase